MGVLPHPTVPIVGLRPVKGHPIAPHLDVQVGRRCGHGQIPARGARLRPVRWTRVHREVLILGMSP